MYEYKTETLGCGFKTKKWFNEELEALLKRYADEGWKLHTLSFNDANCYYVCVFEREI